MIDGSSFVGTKSVGGVLEPPCYIVCFLGIKSYEEREGVRANEVKERE